MLQAAIRVMLGERSRFKGDCKARIDMVHAGIVVATSAKRVLARVYGLPLPALEDLCLSCVLWMPAHKSAAHVGKLRLSNGDLLTKNEVFANDMADGFAKEAVEEHRVAKNEVGKWKRDDEEAWRRARWTGKAANLACNTETYSFKDNEASRVKASEAKAKKHKLKQEKEARDNERRKE